LTNPLHAEYSHELRGAPAADMFRPPTPEQWTTITEHVDELDMVVDVGAGDGLMTSRRAKHCVGVYAIDVNPAPDLIKSTANVQWLESTFESAITLLRLCDPMFRGSVAYLSWPSVSGIHGLTALLEMFQRVIYVGDSFDCTMCGDPSMWSHLSRREVLAHVPSRHVQTIVYGAMSTPARAPDELLAEELAGLNEAAVMPYPYD